MSKFLSKHLFAVSISALVLGGVTVAGVFAAIPDSATGRITGCRNNNTSALKVIDAQNGATCSANETTLRWWSDSVANTSPAPKTAIFHLSESSADPDFPAVYNPAYSRGIVGVKTLVANDPTNNPQDARGYCLDLDFTVLYSSPQYTAVYPLSLEGTPNAGNFDSICGTGYDVFVPSTGGKQEMFFSE